MFRVFSYIYVCFQCIVHAFPTFRHAGRHPHQDLPLLPARGRPTSVSHYDSAFIARQGASCRLVGDAAPQGAVVTAAAGRALCGEPLITRTSCVHQKTLEPFPHVMVLVVDWQARRMGPFESAVAHEWSEQTLRHAAGLELQRRR